MNFIPEQVKGRIRNITSDEQLQRLWNSYQKKFMYAADITYSDVCESTRKLLNLLK